MPELPEVETIRTQLADRLIGRKIVDIDVRLPKVWEGSKDWVIGSKIKDVRRRAKIIIIELDNGYNLVVHLKMTGQLVYGETTAETISFREGIPFAGFALPAKTTHVVLKLDPPSHKASEGQAFLFFNDMRQFGWMKIMSSEQLTVNNQKLGPEALGDDFTPEYLAKICSNWGRPIKLLLMEQGKVAGIGNIYANEALWEAGISPMKRGRQVAEDSLSCRKLHEAIQKVLRKGLEYGGSSAADEAFVNALGKKGHMQEHFVVYQKNGQECPRCKNKIVRSTIGGRGTFFCPKCQN